MIFTDGAWEDGRAGIGAVIIDLSTNFSVVLEGSVPDPLLQMWLREVGDQLICQIELYTMVVIRWVYASLLQGRRTIWWVDNDAARYSLIKGSSSSLTMKDLCREFYRHEAVAPNFLLDRTCTEPQQYCRCSVSWCAYGSFVVCWVCHPGKP